MKEARDYLLTNSLLLLLSILGLEKGLDITLRNLLAFQVILILEIYLVERESLGGREKIRKSAELLGDLRKMQAEAYIDLTMRKVVDEEGINIDSAIDLPGADVQIGGIVNDDLLGMTNDWCRHADRCSL